MDHETRNYGKGKRLQHIFCCTNFVSKLAFVFLSMRKISCSPFREMSLNRLHVAERANKQKALDIEI